MRYVKALIISLVAVAALAGCTSQPAAYPAGHMMDGRQRVGVSMMDHVGLMGRMMRDDLDQDRRERLDAPWWHHTDGPGRAVHRACPMWRR